MTTATKQRNGNRTAAEEMADMEDVVDSIEQEAPGKFFYDHPDDEHFYVNRQVQALMRAVVRIAKKGEHLVVGMRGPTGCGKTSTPLWLGQRMKRPVYILDCPTLREPKDVFGFKDIVPDGKGGHKIVWQKSAFVEAIQTPNAIIVLDEATRIHPSVMNGLMPLLDHRGSVWLEDLGEHVTVAEGVIFFVTANIGLQYSGTWRWDAAFENRLHCQIDVDYLEAEVEIDVLVKKTEVEEDIAKRLVEVANLVRNKVRDESDPLTQAISTRQLLWTSKLIKEGMPPRDALEFTVLPNYSTEGGDASDRANVLTIVQGKLAKS